MRISHIFFGILISFALASGCADKISEEKETVHVLFLGNSLTYFHDMPQMVQSMVSETNPNIVIDQITFPGVSLESHVDFIVENEQDSRRRAKDSGELSKTELKLMEKQWDIVILQEGTVRLLIPEATEHLVTPSIQKIKNIVQNKDCRFILFHTWASNKEYPHTYCYPAFSIYKKMGSEQYCSVEILNQDQEFNLINQSYQEVARTNNIEKSNNGEVARKIIAEHPEINIFEDQIHPSKAGSFLNACVFYEMLTGRTPESLEFDAGLDDEVSKTLKIYSAK